MIIDFRHKKGKRAGTINISEFAAHLGKQEGTLRTLKRVNPRKFNMIYLGAICAANGITAEMLCEIIQKNKKGK